MRSRPVAAFLIAGCAFACTNDRSKSATDAGPAAPSASGTATIQPYDEGFWPFDLFPREEAARRRGVTLTEAWLAHAQKASVRVGERCSGAFVSAYGLIATNQDCIEACAQQVADANVDGVAAGFDASRSGGARRCPGLEVRRLAGTEDVTAAMDAALANVPDDRWLATLLVEADRQEARCGADRRFVCDLVPLYQGARYVLHRYEVIRDVRLELVPELDVAYFGGDAHNFRFPRWNIDFAFVRVFDAKGAPLATPEHFRFRREGPKEGEAVFVAGHAGWTQRHYSLSRLLFHRDVDLSTNLGWYRERRGVLLELARKSEKLRRETHADLLVHADVVFARTNLRDALTEPALLARKSKSEADLRGWVASNPELHKRYGTAWDRVDKSLVVYRSLAKELQVLETEVEVFSPLLAFARGVVRGAAEKALPSAQRLRELQDGRIDSFAEKLLDPTRLEPEIERAKLALWLAEVRETLGADAPLVQQIMGDADAYEVAGKMVAGTKLFDHRERRRLWEGGNGVVAHSPDPMLVLARAIDPAARELRRRVEAEAEGPLRRASADVARAALAFANGRSAPDGMFTLRISHGVVQAQPGAPVFTNLGGMFARASGHAPFALPARWLAAKSRLDLAAPVNFTITTPGSPKGDVGAPVFTANGDLVGVVFDGNIGQLQSAFDFGDARSRAIALHPAAIFEALDKVHGASRLVSELEER